MPNGSTNAPSGDGSAGNDGARAVLERALGRVLWELRPYLTNLVVIGGWVPYLYQQYGPFPAWRAGGALLSLTAEVDVLVTRELPPGDRPPVAAILRAAGFEPGSAAAPAAVWANDPARGEKIEFLVPHTGTIRDLGRVVAIGAQRDVGAIALTTLDIMQRHAATLPVPAVAPDGARQLVTVRLPRLGAYVLNKAVTFLRRQPVSGIAANPKQAKDLLYLRDVMHGGPEVADTVERDIAEILTTDVSVQGIVDTGASSLDGAVRSAAAPTVARLAEVAAMLTEREPTWERGAAVANVTGHLTDLRDILVAFRSPDSPRGGKDDA